MKIVLIIIATLLRRQAVFHNTQWLKSDTYAKEKLQRRIFPDGIFYNKEKHAFRTEKINAVINQIACLSGDLRYKRGWSKSLLIDKSRSAEREGFEPSVRLPAQRFSRPPHSAALASLR